MPRLLIRVALFLTVIALPLLAGCQTQPVSKATGKVKPYLVQIAVVSANSSGGQGITPLGTGFLVNRAGWVIVAAHVIDLGNYLTQQAGGSAKTLGVIVPAPEGVGASFPSSGQVPTNRFNVFSVDDVHDIALLKLKTEIGPNPFNGGVLPSITYSNGTGGTITIGPLPLDSRVPKAGTSLGVSGYPLTQLSLATKMGRLTSAKPIGIADAKLAHLPNGFISEPLFDCYTTSIASNPQLSGAPVFDARGLIVGVYLSVVDEPGALLVPAKYVTDLLNNAGIAWAK